MQASGFRNHKLKVLLLLYIRFAGLTLCDWLSERLMQPAELASTASSAKLVQFMGSLHARGFHMLQPVINLGTNSGGVHELVSLSGRPDL